MTRLEALKELAAKVEAGRWEANTPTLRTLWADLSHDQVMTAFNGSLDAAAALHKAVLPEWHYAVDGKPSGCEAQVFTVPTVDEIFMCDVEMEAVATVNENNPARAWLLAILRALIAQEEAQ